MASKLAKLCHKHVRVETFGRVKFSKQDLTSNTCCGSNYAARTIVMWGSAFLLLSVDFLFKPEFVIICSFEFCCFLHYIIENTIIIFL